MKLFEVVRTRIEVQRILSDITAQFTKDKDRLTAQIQKLIGLENVSVDGFDVEKIQMAESVLYIHGDPYGVTDGGKKDCIADAAIADIANGCRHLKKEFFGNKTYSGYYQRCDCNYGYGPSHGGIRDEIGLKDSARKRELTDDEKDACIYYVKNYTAIKKSLSLQK